ncbi:unnamed protein product [Clonostachys byssicola]|uniref:Uncharacterized protein n=1 Tax=Clonostachys byssicola TaxID=160290 RepID=A0A9N9U5T1_9HYPO|nr:unnamed protein product [Clonostachys byssicola]
MHFISIVAALALASGTQAWTKDGQGNWVANNNCFATQSSYNPCTLANVHESCTRMNDNTVIYRNNEACAYWTDGAGTIKRGHKCIRPRSLRKW